ncbi:MAG TPA: hypothetical protein VFI06_15925 [Chitinophagaceae bacterium]|nr:hypothetical protein [Chitinophagaceae bacterium]
MTYIKRFRHFRRAFFKPRVVVFILVGVGIMFLTFLTKDNPLELAIAGIASIFIGIGVNNFTLIETEQKDERRLTFKIQHAIKTLRHVQVKIKKIKSLPATDPSLTHAELEEMLDYIQLCVQYLEEV